MNVYFRLKDNFLLWMKPTNGPTNVYDGCLYIIGFGLDNLEIDIMSTDLHDRHTSFYCENMVANCAVSRYPKENQQQKQDYTHRQNNGVLMQRVTIGCRLRDLLCLVKLKIFWFITMQTLWRLRPCNLCGYFCLKCTYFIVWELRIFFGRPENRNVFFISLCRLNFFSTIWLWSFSL